MNETLKRLETIETVVKRLETRQEEFISLFANGLEKSTSIDLEESFTTSSAKRHKGIKEKDQSTLPPVAASMISSY
jgi:hypothetical protein